MSIRTMFVALALIVPLPAAAGPCTSMIEVVQGNVDSYIDRMAGAGNAAKESTAATMGRQPTPDSVAKAEAGAGDPKAGEKAMAALERARKFDAAGNRAGCTKALARARKLIGA